MSVLVIVCCGLAPSSSIYPSVHLIAIQPEYCLENEVGQAQAVHNLLPLRTLLVVDLNVQHSAIQLGQLASQIQDLLVGRQLAHGCALAMCQHGGIQVVVLQVVLRALAGTACGQLRMRGKSED